MDAEKIGIILGIINSFVGIVSGIVAIDPGTVGCELSEANLQEKEPIGRGAMVYIPSDENEYIDDKS